VQCLSEQAKISPILKISGFVFLHFLLFTLPLIHGAHLRLLFDAQTGLDSSMVMEAFINVSLVRLIKFIELRDYIFLLLPIGLFWLVLLTSRDLKVWMVRVQIASLIFLSSVFILTTNHKSNHEPAEIRFNPALFLLSDVAENVLFKHASENRSVTTVNEDESGIQSTRIVYKNQIKTIKYLPAKTHHPWNIVILIMESVGTRYMFDTTYGNPMPMPFLDKIAKESWHLKRHYTPSNISTKAIFSLLSGLYDFFSRETFGIRSDARVPSIYNLLTENYDSFLVTPSSISWYFPTAFVKNGGLPEVHSYENLNFKIKEELHSLGRYIARDEIQTMDFFIQRLNKAREPFLGIYISFTAHLPYFDYGPEYRIVEDDGRAISRYYNNLNLLDHMINRIYDNLKNQGLLERTIFVIVGDHGQAFGQHHPDNYMHHRYSYNENLETPAIIHQPALFKPKAFELPTSHVDLLPTLLDAMRISYSPDLFDGESLFQNRLRRKYLFFYGHEECISSLDSDFIKVQFSLKKNRCWAFDLKRDPDEKNPLDCSLYEPQFEALRKFVGDHDLTLVKYNENLKEEKALQGYRQPSF
jgi:membrane-anchored protein YejM (alkaline phosphatase superfamily)